MDFKFFSDNVENRFTINEHMGVLQLYQPEYDRNNVEFCFQFNDDEPVVFASGPNDLHINITPTHNGNVTFNDNGNVFKIFARERNRGNVA